MAIALRRSSALEKASALCKFSFSFLRNWSTTTSAANDATAADSAGAASKRPKRRKKKNFFEVAQFLPNWGVGYHMAKTHWTTVSYEITKINLYKDGRHGKAWGIAHKDGIPAVAPKKISGVHKRCWRYVAKLKKTAESASNPDFQAA